jgi:hypothetical protein
VEESLANLALDLSIATSAHENMIPVTIHERQGEVLIP